MEREAPPDDLSVFAQNLWRLIKRSGKSINGWTEWVNGRQPGEPLTQSTIDRILKGADASVTMITKIAAAVGIDPWELLHPGGLEQEDRGLHSEVYGLALLVNKIDDEIRRQEMVNKLDYVRRWLVSHPQATLIEVTERKQSAEGDANAQPNGEPTQVLQLRA
jgi:hypothetical protein